MRNPFQCDHRIADPLDNSSISVRAFDLRDRRKPLEREANKGIKLIAHLQQICEGRSKPAAPVAIERGVTFAQCDLWHLAVSHQEILTLKDAAARKHRDAGHRVIRIELVNIGESDVSRNTMIGERAIAE